MANFNFNLGVFSSIQVFLCCLLFFNVVLLHADTEPSNDVASIVCPKTRNSSLCWKVLKPAGSTNALELANHTLRLAHTSAVEDLRLARLLEAAETANPLLKKRYSECSRRFDFAVRGIEEGKEALATGGYILLKHAISAAVVDADGCLKTFKQPPPELSPLPKKAKNLGDICHIAVCVSTILAGDDY